MKLDTPTTHEIMKDGLALAPELNRDKYFQLKWVRLDKVREAVKELKGRLFIYSVDGIIKLESIKLIFEKIDEIFGSKLI